MRVAYRRAALAAALFCVLSAVPAAAAPEVVTFPGSAGAVRFNHAGHARRADCAVCHHPAGEPAACRFCHTGSAELPRHRDALHKTCTACHRQKGLTTRCRDCHAPPDGRRPTR